VNSQLLGHTSGYYHRMSEMAYLSRTLSPVRRWTRGIRPPCDRRRNGFSIALTKGLINQVCPCSTRVLSRSAHGYPLLAKSSTCIFKACSILSKRCDLASSSFDKPSVAANPLTAVMLKLFYCFQPALLINNLFSESVWAEYLRVCKSKPL
jgi:hypothetical protein